LRECGKLKYTNTQINKNHKHRKRKRKNTSNLQNSYGHRLKLGFRPFEVEQTLFEVFSIENTSIKVS